MDNMKEKTNKQSTKVVIITSIDDQDHHPILSCLNSTNFETIMVDLNRTSSKSIVRRLFHEE